MTLEPLEDKELFAYVFKTRADPFAGRINLFRVYQGTMTHDTQVLNTRTHSKERIGQLVTFEGANTGHTTEYGPGALRVQVCKPEPPGPDDACRTFSDEARRAFDNTDDWWAQVVRS